MNKNICDYRMVIVDYDGEIYKYDKVVRDTLKDIGHEECIHDYCKKKGYKFKDGIFVRPEFVAARGNIMYLNFDSNTLCIYLPVELSKAQLYMLDYMENFLSGFDRIDAMKFDTEAHEVGDAYYSFDREDGDDPIKMYSEIIVQSYYGNGKKM